MNLLGVCPLFTAHCLTAHLLFVTQINSFNRSRSPRLFIDVDDRAADAHLVPRVIGLAVNWRGEAINNVTFLHSDHAPITTGHSQISKISRAFMKNPLVRSLHVGVRA